MKNLLFILIVLFTLSCNRSFGIKGDSTIYKYGNKDFGASGELVLKQDGTFTYKYAVGLIYQESKGNWSQISEDSILINSDASYKNGFLEVRELEERQPNDETVIKIINKENKKPLIGINVAVGENKDFVTNAEGIILVKERKLKKLTISYFPKHYVWEFQIPPKGNIEIEIVAEDLSKAYFENEKWKKKRKKLISPDGKVYKKEK